MIPMNSKTWVSLDEFNELRDKLEPIVMQFAEKHLQGECLTINYSFGTVTIEV